MTRLTAPAVLLVVLVLAGCVYYPTVPDIGGVRIRPKNGVAVREAAGLAVYMDLDNTGKYGDTLVAVSTPAARAAQVVATGGAPLTALDVPGEALTRLHPLGEHIVLSDLTRPVASGDVILVTLVFTKSGQIGAITRVE